MGKIALAGFALLGMLASAVDANGDRGTVAAFLFGLNPDERIELKELAREWAAEMAEGVDDEEKKETKGTAREFARDHDCPEKPAEMFSDKFVANPFAAIDPKQW